MCACSFSFGGELDERRASAGILHNGACRCQAAVQRAANAPVSGLEAQDQSGLRAVVDELEEVVVLPALLALEEVGEVIAELELDPVAPAVHEPCVGVSVALLHMHGTAFLTKTVDPRESTPRHGRPHQPMFADRVIPAEP